MHEAHLRDFVPLTQTPKWLEQEVRVLCQLHRACQAPFASAAALGGSCSAAVCDEAQTCAHAGSRQSKILLSSSPWAEQQATCSAAELCVVCRSVAAGAASVKWRWTSTSLASGESRLALWSPPSPPSQVCSKVAGGFLLLSEQARSRSQPHTSSW